VLKIGPTEVRTLDDAKAAHEAALKRVDQERKVVLSILRNGLLRQVVLDYSRDYERE